MAMDNSGATESTASPASAQRRRPSSPSSELSSEFVTRRDRATHGNVPSSHRADLFVL
jgi:hypothetical protein